MYDGGNVAMLSGIQEARCATHSAVMAGTADSDRGGSAHRASKISITLSLQGGNPQVELSGCRGRYGDIPEKVNMIVHVFD